ncbi:leucine-rich repeat domain-containing protein [Polaribacter sp. Q13]|uniref:leucine-rich repeat domain-containing protein n=1 Tax=Polaribacter sp. Q13 TaxID=2806551 RepID=UPI00193BB9E0|nr:leucine-rich repeat domain-containing protein [Polaribacter sp. Q13]QVY67278.1 leucine-rich repeat domain-containing protein [Polaribacter sp. Q13]
MKTPEILKLENELGVNLKQLEVGGVFDSKNRNSYLLNDNQEIMFLNLHKNKLKDISALSSLNSLIILDLGENQITDISPLFYLKSLFALNLSSNQLTDINPLFSLINLSNLNLSSNNLNDVNPLSNLTSLIHLDLNFNKITNINPLSTLRSLTNLSLSSNQITDISSLSYLTKLTSLSTGYNQLIDINPLSTLIFLINLDLRKNQITDISSLSSLTNLTLLLLSENRLVSIESLSSLTNLTRLNLGYNRLSNINEVSNLFKIKTLAIERNQLTDIESLRPLTSLESLTLSFNNLSSIEPLSSLVELTNLSLEYNELKDVTHLSHLRNLVSLCLGNNKLTNIDSLSSLTKLSNLELDSNRIINVKSIQNIVNNLSLLRVINIRNNLLDIPYNLLNDANGLIAYFKDIKLGVTNKRNTKLLFLGDGCVGKSTLLAHLKTLKPPTEIPINKRTEGVQLGVWKDVLPDVKVNVWDFGGQEVLHSTHRLFLGEEAVYVLVWCKESKKKCSKEETHNLQYWLDFIADYGRKSIVLLVENVIDGEFESKELPDDLELATLVTNYRNKQIELIPTQYRFDCKNNTEEVESFRDVIKNKIKSLHKRYPIKYYPESWHVFQERLEKEKETHKIISLERYEELGKESKVSEPKALLSFFDKSGVIGYYERLADDIIILQMDWVLDPVYKTIQLKDNTLARTQGKLNDEDLDFIWNKYQPEERRLFKEYMLKSNLLSEPKRYPDSLNRSYKYLCPSLFDDKSIDTIQWEEKERYVIVKFNFVFLAIIQQLQVQILNHCNFDDKEIFYKNYICFKDKEGSLVWIELYKNEKELRIFSENENTIQVVLSELNLIYPIDRTLVRLRKKDLSEEDYLYKNTDNFFHSKNEIKDYKIMEEEMDKEKKAKKIFISYSRKDYKFKDELKSHLSLLARYNLINAWSCDEMKPGKWNSQIQSELAAADIIVYMVSHNFLDSNYIMDEEVKKGIELIEEDPNKKIINVLVRDCLWDQWSKIEELVKKRTKNFSEMSLDHYQFLPYHQDDGVEKLLPLEEWNVNRGQSVNTAYKQIAKRILSEII